MTTLLVLCCFLLNRFFSADTTGLQQKTRRHVRRSKRTRRVWKNIHLVLLITTRQKKKSDFKAHAGRRESVEWQHCRGGAGRHSAYASINEVLFAYSNRGTACNVILQGSSVPPLALRRWGVSLSQCSPRADSTLQNRANPNWLLPQLKWLKKGAHKRKYFFLTGCWELSESAVIQQK